MGSGGQWGVVVSEREWSVNQSGQWGVVVSEEVSYANILIFLPGIQVCSLSL